MSKSFQNEVPPSRINIKLDLHTGGAQKKVELPLKLLVTGDYSNGQDKRDLAEKEKVNINKNNFDSVLSDFNPKANLTVKNTLSPAGGEMNVNLDFKSIARLPSGANCPECAGIACLTGYAQPASRFEIQLVGRLCFPSRIGSHSA